MRKRLRIFISSPGDVRSAREIAALTIERLAQDYARFFEVEPFLWEYEAMIASGHFQDSIEPPSQFDIVVLILWSRLGTLLPARTAVRDYLGIDGRSPLTGTEWEYEEALRAAQQAGVPDLLVYRSQQHATIDVRDARRREQQLQQLQALDDFWQRHFVRRDEILTAHTMFATDAEFAAAFEQQMRKLIDRRVASMASGTDRVGRSWTQAPFRGLESYDFEHAPIFFGQDEALSKAMLQLATSAESGSPFLLLLGASGSGKSSLAKAGIVPKLFVLRRIAGVAFLRRALFRPSDARDGEDLFDALARRLTTPGGHFEGIPELIGPGQSVAQLASHLRHTTQQPAYPIGATLGLLAQQARQQGHMLEYESARIVLVIDQLEELFTDERLTPEVRRRFISLLAGLVQSGLVWIVATMRKDFWHRADETAELVGLAQGPGRLELLPPSFVQLSQMIRRPAEAAGVRFEVHPTTNIALNEAIAEEVASEPGALPLLSYLLDQLYRIDVLESGGNALTYRTYERLGRLEGAIATRAESVLERCAPEDRQALGSVLFSLVQMGNADGDIERAVARRVALSSFPSGSSQRRLLDALLDPDARLLVVDVDSQLGPTVRVAHEALLSRWQQARDFIQSNAATLRIRRRIEERYALWRGLSTPTDAALAAANPGPRRWLHFGREPGLLTDIDLTDGQRLLREHVSNTDAHLADYIARSVAQDRRARSRGVRVLALVASVVTVLALAASITGAIAVRKEREALEQTAQTLKAQSQLLTEAASERLNGADVAGAQSLILYVLSNSATRPYNPTTVSAFQQIRAADRRLAVLAEHRDVVDCAAYSPDGARIVTASYDASVRVWDSHTGVALLSLAGHSDRVVTAAYSPDSTRIVTASLDKTARIWDARTGAQLMLLSHGAAVESASFSPDGNRIVTAADDKSVRIWDAHTGTQLTVLTGHADAVHSAAYSPDGTRIVSASLDKTVRIWDARSATQLRVLTGHGDAVETASYSPDGARIVSASYDKTARVWDAGTGAQLAVLPSDGGWVRSAAFSPDGAYIVTASFDRTARIWDAHTSTQLAVLSGHNGWVVTAAYSPDGTHIVTASYDKTARIWDASIGAQLRVLAGHRERVQSAAYSPDGLRIVTASYDKTARIWDARTGSMLTVLDGHGDRVQSAAYSPDGGRIVTASIDRTARIWDAHSGAQQGVLSGHSDIVESAVFSPDGSHIVTASFDRTARIWDARTGALLHVLSGHGGWVLSAAYSPDGTRIVTASLDRTARIWDANSGAQLAVLSGHDAWLRTAAYSPDGTRIITASKDKTARIWDARTGAPLGVLTGHTDIVESAAFSPDGRYIVTASDDATARLWDARTTEQLAVLSGHSAVLRHAAYSPDGEYVVTASDDGTARIWRAQVPAPLSSQIDWYQAAEFDRLSAAQQLQLGLPAHSTVRSWPGGASACDQAASAAYDPDRRAPGTSDIAADVANAACTRELEADNDNPRLAYESGRAMLVKHDVAGARREFEYAVSHHYRAAEVDLADLLLDPNAAMLDCARAIALYQQAWGDQVAIAAFKLGHLFESGAPASHGDGKSTALEPDPVRAWEWYAKGASAAEPNALARFARRDERDALSESSDTARNALLQQAFGYYAAAVQRASEEDWPDAAWLNWRYHRASLARLLARDGMMNSVAATYASTAGTHTQQRRSVLQRLEASLHW